MVGNGNVNQQLPKIIALNSYSAAIIVQSIQQKLLAIL